MSKRYCIGLQEENVRFSRMADETAPSPQVDSLQLHFFLPSFVCIMFVGGNKGLSRLAEWSEWQSVGVIAEQHWIYECGALFNANLGHGTLFHFPLAIKERWVVSSRLWGRTQQSCIGL